MLVIFGLTFYFTLNVIDRGHGQLQNIKKTPISVCIFISYSHLYILTPINLNFCLYRLLRRLLTWC